MNPHPANPVEPPDPRDALPGADVSDAAIAEATIAKLRAQVAEAREALEFYSCSEGCDNEACPIRKYDGGSHCGSRARAALAKLSEGETASLCDIEARVWRRAAERAGDWFGQDRHGLATEFRQCAEQVEKGERPKGMEGL